MTEVGTIGDIKVPIAIEFASASRELKLALLQAQLSEKAKTSAMDTMNEIEEIQNNKQLASKYYEEALKQQAAATATAKTGMSADMLAYMEKNNLAFETGGAIPAGMTFGRGGSMVTINRYNATHRANGYPQYSAGWDKAIASLKAHMEAADKNTGTAVQQKMVFAQDFMGQYNSYLQGANSSIQQFFQNLGEAARIR
jgi:hypothetical protein